MASKRKHRGARGGAAHATQASAGFVIAVCSGLLNFHGETAGVVACWACAPMARSAGSDLCTSNLIRI